MAARPVELLFEKCLYTPGNWDVRFGGRLVGYWDNVQSGRFIDRYAAVYDRCKELKNASVTDIREHFAKKFNTDIEIRFV